MNITTLITENARRQEVLRPVPYHPDTGLGATGARTPVTIPSRGVLHLPNAMLADTSFSPAMPWNDLVKLRFRHDFEYWCVTCVNIKDKGGNGLIPFQLNYAQRRVLTELEAMRTADKPIRMIILKARQWGSSTLIQCYMAWIQIVLREYWNAVICAHVKDTAKIIGTMYSRILDNYPLQYWDGEKTPKFRSVASSQSLFEIAGRNSTLAFTSSNNQMAMRGSDLTLAHLSEVAYWPTTRTMDPENTIASICSSVNLSSHSMIVLESTANGVGNFFHSEWVRTSSGRSDKVGIFIPWYEIEQYTCPVPDVWKFWESMTLYERHLWNSLELTLEQIYWYHCKLKSLQSTRAMMAEFPTDAIEAFTATDTTVFSRKGIETLRIGCCDPLEVGELHGADLKGAASLARIKFTPDTLGNLKVWARPNNFVAMRNRYIITVDIGGRSDSSDYSVIAVFDRKDQDNPEIVAQWRGHCDADLLAWKAAQIAQWYNKGLLVIESNTLETATTQGADGAFILDELNYAYRNLYYRETSRPGFHTNRQTKATVINSLVGNIRDNSYIERDQDALNEAETFEHKPNGTYGAKLGYHDDIVMTRAIGLYLCAKYKRRTFDYDSIKPP